MIIIYMAPQIRRCMQGRLRSFLVEIYVIGFSERAMNYKI